MAENKRAVDRSGPYRDIMALGEGTEQLFRLLYRRREIGVSENRHTPARLKHSVPHAVALSAICPIRDEPDRRDVARPVLCDPRSVIG